MAGSEGVIAAVDLDTGEVLLVEAIEETDEEAVKAFVLEVVEAFAPEAIVTDEAESYASAVADAAAREEEEAGRTLAHHLCAVHFRRSKGRRLRNIAEQALAHPLLAMEARALRALLRSPPEVLTTVGRKFYCWYWWASPPGKGEKMSLAYRLRRVALDMWEKGVKVSGETNNATERAIGCAFKLRVKSMRGFKKRVNRDCFLYLGSWFYAHRDGASLAALFS